MLCIAQPLKQNIKSPETTLFYKVLILNIYLAIKISETPPKIVDCSKVVYELGL
jgi:hypothetical protein